MAALFFLSGGEIPLWNSSGHMSVVAILNTQSRLRWHCLSASVSSEATWTPSPSTSDSPFSNHLPTFVLSCLFLTKAEKISNIYLAWLHKASATWKLSSKACWASFLRYAKAPPPPPASSDLAVRCLHLTSWLQLECTAFWPTPEEKNQES